MLEKNMKILATVFLVIVSALFSMTGFINIVSLNHVESAPVIMLLFGLTLILIAGTARHKA